MRRLLALAAPLAVSGLILFGLILLASRLAGQALAPPPSAIGLALMELALDGSLWREMGVTVGRALLGILIANAAGLALGLLAGAIPGAMRLVSPLVAALQSCPPVVWISLVMVWAGTGGAVPVVTVFAATFPFVFSATAQGVMALDGRVLAMSRLYQVPLPRILRRFALPGILPFWLSSLSTVLAAGWKAAAVAEFMGSHEGIGAKLFWAMRRLDMEAFFAWALALVLLGVALDSGLILPLRRKVADLAMRGRHAAA